MALAVVSRERARRVDAELVAAGIPSLLLMENAGRAAAEVCVELLRRRRGALREARVVVLCGAGNNGGDGYVVARRLATLGLKVRVFSSVPTHTLRGDAAVNWEAWRALCPEGVTCDLAAVRLAEADLLVDALLGTGVSRGLDATMAGTIEAMNRAPAATVSLDVPSGLDAERGACWGACVEAEVTVTFAQLKAGLFSTQGREVAGRVVLVDIGVAPSVAPVGAEAPLAWLVGLAELQRLFPPRARTAHKGVAGRVLVCAGGPGKLGAARLSVRGALRGGAGLVTVATRAECAARLEQSAIEEMTCALGDDPAGALGMLPADVVVVGPGLGLDDFAEACVASLCARAAPLVVDADALRLLAGAGARSSDEWAVALCARRSVTVLTPHPGEAAALMDTSVAAVEADRLGAARWLAQRYAAYVVLKGACTVVCDPGGQTWLCGWGSSVLGVGGSGDVLSGLLAARLVDAAPGSGRPEGYGALDATLSAVVLHALTGEWLEAGRGGAWLREPVDELRETSASERGARAAGGARTRRGARTERGVLAREIADALPAVYGQLVSRGRASG